MSKLKKHIHKFRLESEPGGRIKRIFIDDEELTGVYEAHIDLTVDDLPTVVLTLRMCTDQVDIDFPEADVTAVFRKQM